MQKKLAKIAAQAESEIDYSDIPATKASDWKNAERGRFTDTTAYLLGSPANAERLNEAIAELEAGKGTPRQLIE